MAKKYKIVYDRANCISAGVCVAMAPEHWVMDAPDGLADIHPDRKPTTRDDGWQELILDESEFDVNLYAAEACPVQVISIYELESGKQVYPEKKE